MWSRRDMLGACAAMVYVVPRFARAAQPSRRISILTAPLETLGAYGLGVKLGATEAERAATLLGHQFAVVHSGTATARVAPVAPDEGHLAVVAMTGDANRPCVYLTESPDDTRAATEHAGSDGERVIADWHPGFRRYGAGELNERFERAFKTGMSPEAWHGWVAVKAVLEAALRDDDLCAGLARLRFDGHKGRALRFDAKTRRLRHPSLIIRKVGEKDVIEVAP